MKRELVWVVMVLLAGCVKSESKQCGDFTCSPSSVCAPSGDHCVGPSQLEACQGKADGDGCSFPGTDVGVCDAAVCVVSGCGNGIVETMSDEVCDDGNRSSGDGCRADCKSMETCGDGITDFSVGESCDCGADDNALPFGCNGVNSASAGASCRSDCSLGRCGDTVIDPGETCDDGNTVPGDGCRADCAGRWTLMASQTQATIFSVWAASKTDAWVAAGPHVLHWDGSTWKDATPPGSGGYYTKVWGLNANDVFVLSPAIPGQIWRHTNGAWQNKTPVLASTTWTALHSTGNELWVLGQEVTGVSLYLYATHWNGTSFDTPSQGFQMQNSPEDVFVGSNGDVYFTADNGGSTQTFARYANGQWNVALSSKQVESISGLSPTDITGVGGSGAFHYGASGWAPIAEGNYFAAHSVHSIASVTIAAGTQGGVMQCTATLCTPSPTGILNLFYDVFALSDKEAFVVGELGTILY